MLRDRKRCVHTRHNRVRHAVQVDGLDVDDIFAPDFGNRCDETVGTGCDHGPAGTSTPLPNE